MAEPGTLVKLHGTVEDPHSLAFTDLELLEPLSGTAADHLAGLASDRVVVLYGYAGADADLRSLLDEVFASASRVVWFQPDLAMRANIKRAFPAASIEFRPEVPDGDMNFRQGAEEFIATLAGWGADLGEVNDSELFAGPHRDYSQLRLPVAAPGIASARLVERFGSPTAQEKALRSARAEDLAARRWRTIPGYLRWGLASSLYGDGLAARTVGWLAEHLDELGLVRPQRIRNYAITRACALKLRAGDWEGLLGLSNWAIDRRDNPSDKYYRAHARRYAFEIAGARDDADNAATGLSAARDAERHAGAVLEQGIVAIYQGRFGDALEAAFELRERTGRYAIPRWHAWGAWLEAIALCYQGKTWDAREMLKAETGRFDDEQLVGAIADVRTAEFLAARVDFALGRGSAPDVEFADVEKLTPRYMADRLLLAADTHIGAGQHELAEDVLEEVKRQDACPTAVHWAELGLAEIDRHRHRLDRARERFEQLAVLGIKAGAFWFARQAIDGIALCGTADRATELEASLPNHLRPPLAPAPLGNPRMLWMMTT